MGEDLECLCQIMRTVGPRLDHEKAKVSCFNVSIRGLNALKRIGFVSSLYSFAVFNESVLRPYAILNEQQGLAC